MDPFTITMGVMALVKAGSSIIGGIKAKKEAKEAGKDQAATDLRATQERVLQINQEERQLAGQTRAGAVGSGVKADVGAPLVLMAEQARTFARERAFTKEVGAEKAKNTIRRSSMVGSQTRRQGFSQGMSDISNAFGIFRQA